MSINGIQTLAVIPARGGSKSIPRKNLCPVGGISLVGRACRVALALDWLDHAVLSTDDVEIADDGRQHGIDVPFMRPDELSGDMAGSVDMWRHAWLAAEAHYGKRFDISILLEPTSPLRTPEDVTLTVDTLVQRNCMAAATISPAPAHFTPHKCLTLGEDAQIGFYLKDGAKYAIRQKIPPYYFRNGVCYAVRRETLVDKGFILEENCAGIVIDRHLVNIDEPIDLEWAQFLLNRQAEKK